MKKFFTTILTLLFIGSLALAQTTELKSAIAGSGASKAESTNFRLKPVIGQAVSGNKSTSIIGVRPFYLNALSSTTPSADPFISDFTPQRGGPFTQVTINGGNFGSDAGSVTVEFGSESATIVSVSPTQIVVEVPADNVSGDVNIRVTVNGNDVTSDSQFTVIPPPEIRFATDNTATFPDNEQSVDLQVEVITDYGITNVVFYYRPLRGDDNSVASEDAAFVSKDGNVSTYLYTVTSDKVDELGMVYYFDAIDEVDNSNSTDNAYLYVSQSTDPQISGLSFGGAPENWRMFSIPYQTDTRGVSQIFGSEDLYGSYDNSKWRLVRWNPSKDDFDEVGRGISTIDEGKGYWFNAKEQRTLTILNTSAPRVTDTSPKTITLLPGWNQIGNPYPFTLDWSDVLTFNGISEGVSDQLTILANGTSPSPTGTLNAWNGAYVENKGTTNVQLQIPFRPLSTARVKRVQKVTKPLNDPHWEVSIDLKSGIHSNTISKIGMLPEAEDFSDHFDQGRVPRLDGYLDLNFDINGKPYSASLRSRKDYDSWEFSVENNLDNEQVQLTWDNSYFGENRYLLILHDLENEKLIEMRAENTYSYRNISKRNFRVYYGTADELEEKIIPDRPVLGQIYPNPFESTLTLNYTLTRKIQPQNIDISIFNMMGQKVKTLVKGLHEEGFYQVEWDSSPLPEGMYLIRMSVGEGQNPTPTMIDTRRIVKK